MLQTIQISGNITFSYEMHTSKAVYVLGKNASIDTESAEALIQLNGLSNDFLTVKGHILGGSESSDSAISFYGSDSSVLIAKTGLVEAGIGFKSGGAQQLLENHGTIDASDRAVWLTSNGTVENFGRLYGHNNGVISGTTNPVHIVNHKGGVIESDVTAINLNSGPNDASTIENDGLIKSNGTWALFLGTGRESVTNHGVIKGEILMGAGADTFDNRGGRVDHDILGQVGNDTLYTDSAQVHLVEEDGQGDDTVKSTVSYTLSDYVENLFLLGNHDTNGKGNGIANYLMGNKGDNVLKGLGGNDILNGGDGNDILTGGAGFDTFILLKHGGHDIVTDFSGDEDVVNLVGQNAIADYADLIANHVHEAHGDLEIRLNGKDTLVLENTDLSHVSNVNFLF